MWREENGFFGIVRVDVVDLDLAVFELDEGGWGKEVADGEADFDRVECKPDDFSFGGKGGEDGFICLFAWA